MDAREIDRLAHIVIDTAFHIHKDLGPGLFESVYETILQGKLPGLGINVESQRMINIDYQGTFIPNAFKVDLLVEECLVVELKSIERLAPVHAKQVITYLRLMKLPVGLLINFGAATLKEGIRRLANNHADLAT
jgi:GxxExxY protein